MAPIRTRTARHRTARVHPKSTSEPTTTQHPAASAANSTSTNTKKSKRLDRHNVLLAKVQQSRVAKPKARRRPGKKLGTGLGELAGALPELDGDEDGDEEQNEEWEGFSDDGGKSDQGVAGIKRRKKTSPAQRQRKTKMKMNTLKSRPGAQKRKQQLEQREAERMGRNMAQLLASSFSAAQETAGGNEKDRWAALRGFIGGTMEQSALFKYSGGKG